MEYRFITDNIEYTGKAFTDERPDHIVKVGIILQGKFDVDGEIKSVEEQGQKIFDPAITYAELTGQVEEFGYALAEEKGWFSSLEKKENAVLERPRKFRPGFSISTDVEKEVDTEAKFDRLALAVDLDEVLDIDKQAIRDARKAKSKAQIRKKIADKLAAKARKILR